MQTDPPTSFNKIVCFCGIDGSGKTTLAALTYEKLKKMGYPVALTKPDAVGFAFHTLLDAAELVNAQDPLNQVPLDLRAVAAAIDRLNSIMHCLKEHPDDGRIIIFDTYAYRSLAYSEAWQADITWSERVCSLNPKPHLSFLCDIPVALAHERVLERGEAQEAAALKPRDRYRLRTAIDLEFLKRLHGAYSRIAQKEGMVMVDTSNAPQDAFRHVWACVSERIIHSAGIEQRARA